MTNHYCEAKQITDLLACEQCGDNQICCKECFPAKHRVQKGPVHKSCKLVESDVYKSFLKIVHVEWLVGQKVTKSLGGFELVDAANKQYLVNLAFYGSQFYKQLFSDETSAQQYLILKCYYTNNPTKFQTLSSLQKILNDVKSLDIINKYIKKLTQPTEQQKVMNSHVDFYTGADIYYLAEFLAQEQQIFYDYLGELIAKDERLNIYKYIEWREKLQKPRNPTYYSNQFTAFLIQYYRKEMQPMVFYTLNQYILNYWEFFHTAVQVNPTLKQFIESEIDFYHQYQQLMQQNNLNITYLGFKIWKLSNGVSKELPYLKNHFFLFAFVQGYLKMKIQRTYAFSTQEEKEALSRETYLDFIKYIKDYSLLLQDKNKSLKQEEKKDFDFETYTTYFAYRKRMEPFHEKIKAGKQNIYNKQIAVKFFNHHFESGLQLKPKLYKEFFEKCEEQKRKEEQKLLKLTEELKQQLQAEEKQNFYEFLFINFLAYCKQNDLKTTKQQYINFKQQSMQNMDEEYIKLTEEKFKRGDFNVVVQEDTTDVTEDKGEQPKTIIGETGAKITVGMDKYEEEILQDNIHEDEESEEDLECLCCRGDSENCKSSECQLMGYCTACME